MAIKTIFITSGTTFTVPADFGSLVSVECIGGGGGGSSSNNGSGGGGGSAYSASNAVTGLSANNSVFINIGAGGAVNGSGGDTWFNVSANSAPTLITEGALAKAGSAPASAGQAGIGGSSASSVGTTKFSGGNGGSS
jgi:hypothetical protein